MTIEDRTTPFGNFCSEFDYHLMTKYWKKFVSLYAHGWSIQDIRKQLRVLSTTQLVEMATAFESQGNRRVKYNAPCCKWDDVHELLPVNLAPKNINGVAHVKCEACRKYYSLRIDYLDKDNFLCNKCEEEWKIAASTGAA